MNLAIAKNILDLLQFKMGKDTDEFKYMRKEIFDYVYNSLKKLFKQLEENEMVEKCTCNNKIRNGFAPCPECGGCGFKDKKI